MESALSSHLKQTLLLLIAVYILLPSVHSTDVKYCKKKDNYVVKVHGVEISPNPVVTGKPATFNISASAGQAISGGKLVIEVSYFAVRVHTETHDLCEEVLCPIAEGSFVLSHTQTLPSITPPVYDTAGMVLQGSYTLKMTLKDENGKQLTCISFRFKIGFRSLVSDN